ncbi:hypothetical protein [Stenotrophomonas maltophilia]|uniref:hypothetical protein n=1 Tax=Stenotrophomonas maltophilia TaxID=40324 RepID=UPI003C2B6D34
MAQIAPQQAGGVNAVAFLDMVAWSEGTDNGKQPTKDRGYDVIVGGQLFKSYADHPRVLVDLPKLKIQSTAAGRYQLWSAAMFGAGWAWRGDRAESSEADQRAAGAEAVVDQVNQTRATEHAKAETLAAIGAKHEEDRAAAATVAKPGRGRDRDGG